MVNSAFDLRLFKAKNHIDDALGVAKRGQQPMPQGQMPMPQPMQQPMQQPTPQGQFSVKPQGQMPAQPQQFRKGGLAMAVKKGHQEGGLASSLPGAKETHDTAAEFVNTRNLHLRDVAGLPRAKGGAAWTRKEGKNPEGGLNAKGRASLKAQGHDIKPPVSAKQAKKSPKSAARRKSFCARMSGMPGPMKDEKGRPTRKALSLRKWDC